MSALLSWAQIGRAERVAEKLANARASLLLWLRRHPGQPLRIAHRNTQSERLFVHRGDCQPGLQWVEILAPIGETVKWLAIHAQSWEGTEGEAKEVADELQPALGGASK